MPTVITSGAKVHKSFGKLWEGALIMPQAKGSMTGRMFVAALEHWWSQLSDEVKSKRLMLVCDSGGGLSATDWLGGHRQRSIHTGSSSVRDRVAQP